MEGQEKLLGGVHDFLMTRGFRGGYAIIATTKRIVGIKPFGTKISQRDIPDEELVQKSVKDKDFEIKKEEISKLLLKKPGSIRGGHLKIVPKSGKEILIKIVTSGPGSGKLALAAFQKVGDLMQAFYPEALELEE
jgi:hypothetical protein